MGFSFFVLGGPYREKLSQPFHPLVPSWAETGGAHQLGCRCSCSPSEKRV